MISVYELVAGMNTDIIITTNIQEGVSRTIVLVISQRSQGDVTLTELITL